MAGLFAKLKDIVVSPDTLRHALGHAWGSLIVWVVAAVATAVAAAVVGGLLLYSFDSENWHTPYIQGDTMQLLAAAPAELGSQTPAPPAKGSQVQ